MSMFTNRRLVVTHGGKNRGVRLILAATLLVCAVLGIVPSGAHAADADSSLSAPVLTSPINDASVGVLLPQTAPCSPPQVEGVRFTWQAVPSAAFYQVQVSKDPAFSDGNIIEEQVVDVSNATDRVLFESNTRYWWRVRGASGTPTSPSYGPWSVVANFIAGVTTLGLSIPTILYPPADATIYGNAAPTFHWHTLLNRFNRYEVQVSSEGSFQDPSALVINRTGTTALGNQAVFQGPPGSLTPGTYYWRVKGLADPCIPTAAFSPASRFQVMAGDPPPAVPMEIALEAMLLNNRIEIVSAFDPDSLRWRAFVPGLPGNPLTAIQPGSLVLVTATQACWVEVSQKVIRLLAGVPTFVAVGESTTFYLTG